MDVVTGLIWHPARRRFEWHGERWENHLPKSAGLRWDGLNAVWFTDNPQDAALLRERADAETQARLAGYSPTPSVPQLTWSSARCRYEGTGPRRQNDIWKDAQFRWDPDHHLWWTTDAEAALLASSFGDPDVRTHIAAEAAKRADLRAASRTQHSDAKLPCPAGLDYMPFQKAGIVQAQRLLGMGKKGVLIGDDMGLGKTVQALGLVNCDPSLQSVLVVVPASLKTNWFREAKRWLTRSMLLGVCATSRPRTRFSGTEYVIPGECGLYDLLIINYDILPQFEADLRDRTWDLLVVDEAHYVKDKAALRAKHVYGWKPGRKAKSDHLKKCLEARKAGKTEPEPPREIAGLPTRQALLLTGTPIVNRPKELWPLISYCDPETWDNEYRFLSRYCQGDSSRFGTSFNGGQNLSELQDRLRTSCMVRRLKKDVLPDLPPKRWQVIEIPPGNLERYVLAEQEQEKERGGELEDLRLAVERAKASPDPEAYKGAVDKLKAAASVAFQEMAKLRKELAVAKIPLVVEHQHEVLQDERKGRGWEPGPEPEPIIAFAYHREVFAELEAEFAGRHAVIHGGIAVGDARQEQVDLFQGGKKDLFLGSIVAAAEGITLTRSAHVVFAELEWRPSKILQSEDRSHRIGQNRAVLIQFLVLEGTIEARMAKAIVEKMRVIEASLDNPYPIEEMELPPLAAELADPSTPFVPGTKTSVGAATSTTKWDDVAREAEGLSPEQLGAIHQGLRILAGQCNWAVSHDGVGFSKIDARLGHELAVAPGLTARQAVLGRKILTRYRNTQLAGAAPHLVETIWPTPPEEL